MTCHRPRARVLLPLLLSGLLAGCVATADPATQACEDLVATMVVEAVNGGSLLVEDGSLWVHTHRATVLLREAGECVPIEGSDVRVGDRIGHDAEEIALSYPMQAWPRHVVVER